MPPQETTAPFTPAPHKTHAVQLLALTGALIVLLLGIGGLQLYLMRGAAVQPHQDFYQSLLTRNTSFSHAQQLRADGRYADAIPSYDAALKAAANDEERIQIELLEARTMMRISDFARAVPLLKEIVASTPNPRTSYARALAVSDIADIYSRGVVTINRDIFKDEPFMSLWVASSTSLSLRHVYEYASSIYPTANSQLHIAAWYARQLPSKGKQPKVLTAADIQAYHATIQQLLSSADTDITALQTDPTMAGDRAEALLARAIVLQHLNRYGDPSSGSVNDAYAEAISAYAAFGTGEDGIARYYNALFLAQNFGASKKDDIQQTLAPLMTPAYAQAPVIDLLKNAHASAFYRQFPKLLASIDSDFKAFLISLGWTAADFPS